MDIGKEQPARIVQPLEEPVPKRETQPQPTTVPAREPVKVPEREPVKV